VADGTSDIPRFYPRLPAVRKVQRPACRGISASEIDTARSRPVSWKEGEGVDSHPLLDERFGMAARWFYRISGEEHGPISTPELVELARSGKLLPSDKVKKNESKWVSASKVRGLFPEESSGSTGGSGVDSDVTEGWEHTTPQTERPPPSPADSGVLSAEAESKSSGEGSASKVIREIRPGTTIGNYRILETLGQGGMGVVLKAQHMRMDRLVALKVLRSQAVSSPIAVRRFQQEVRAAARLSHPNIVTAFDADEVDGVHFLVMEYVNGKSLAELLSQRGKLDVKDALDYVLQTARGLEYAHSEGVIHRDIKPGNLLLDKRGVVKILDMGLASMQETHSEESPQRGNEFVTQENQLLGTFDYMPPEQAEDARSVDSRADIYALGCTMYRLLTGRPPYRGDTSIKKIIAHRDHPIPAIREVRPDVPMDLDRVFQKMVAKRANDRYASMHEVITSLEAAIAGRSRPSAGDSEYFPSSGTAEKESRGSSSLRIQEESVYVPVPSDNDDEFALAAPSEDERYYWKVMGQITGPFTLMQLRKKKVEPDDLIRGETSPDWCRASEIRGLFP